MTKVTAALFSERFWGFDVKNPDELRFAALASIWLRVVFLVGGFVETSYRIDFWSTSHILNSIYILTLGAINAFVLWKLRDGGGVGTRWLLGLAALDIAAITFSVSMSGGFDSRYFAVIYYAIGVFAFVFTSTGLVLVWTTLLATSYVSVCLLVGDGVSFAEKEETELFYRLLALYAVSMAVNLVMKFERARRLKAVQRERELNRQRIEMSQTIHDTTAQSAFTLGLGLEDAIEMADKNPDLVSKLEAMWEVSRSTMWALRQPIDGGLLFSGGKLGDILADHVNTFTTITSIPAKLVLSGIEPQLSEITRSLLFSIAHNALTNALRHSGADSVTVNLKFGTTELTLSVSDDGAGLPDDYIERGYGFKNMNADAERIGGKLEVVSDGGGTTVICSVPYESVPYELDEGKP